jgi:hypothetical protein
MLPQQYKAGSICWIADLAVRLAELLQEQQPTVQDLERRIAELFGIAVDAASLQRLTETATLRQSAY